MPRVIDQEERRAQLARKAMEVIAARGVQGATLRDIADAAGVSVGILQHNFRTRKALLLAAFEMAVDRVEKKVESFSGTTIDEIRQFAVETLPLDKQRKIEWRVLVAFRAEALADSRLAREQRARWRKFRQHFKSAIENGISAGHISKQVDPDQASYAIISAIDGTGMLALFLAKEWNAAEEAANLERLVDAALSI